MWSKQSHVVAASSPTHHRLLDAAQMNLYRDTNTPQLAWQHHHAVYNMPFKSVDHVEVRIELPNTGNSYMTITWKGATSGNGSSGRGAVAGGEELARPHPFTRTPPQRAALT